MEELNEELKRRKVLKGEIQNKLDNWIKIKYGIENFSRKFSTYFSVSAETQTVAVLARQIASVSTEDVACFIGTRLLGMKPVVATFFTDSFSSQNGDKRSRVKINWTSWSKKGNLIKTYEHLAIKSMDKLEHMLLNRIITIYGNNIPDFHLSLRSKFFGDSDCCLDVGALQKTFLLEATNKPTYWYIENENGYAKRSADMSKIEQAVRPPADWYYPYYLSWFLDGSMVLLETYDNPNDDVPEIKDSFVNAMNLIHNNVGVYPLVVRTPILSSDMLSLNRHLLEKPKSLDELEQSAKRLDIENASLPYVFRSVADMVMAYR